jgi:antitoxin (DNA-binding transcriptional repressor) of toxin-antitoxin stability system
VLRKVEAGETVVITLRGKAVADLIPHRNDAPRWISPAELMEIRKTAAADPSWGSFLKQLDEESGDLGPIV